MRQSDTFFVKLLLIFTKTYRLDVFSSLLLNPIKDAVQMCSQFLNDNLDIIWTFNFVKISIK